MYLNIIGFLETIFYVMHLEMLFLKKSVVTKVDSSCPGVGGSGKGQVTLGWTSYTGFPRGQGVDVFFTFFLAVLLGQNYHDCLHTLLTGTPQNRSHTGLIWGSRAGLPDRPHGWVSLTSVSTPAKGSLWKESEKLPHTKR